MVGNLFSLLCTSFPPSNQCLNHLNYSFKFDFFRSVWIICSKCLDYLFESFVLFVRIIRIICSNHSDCLFAFEFYWKKRPIMTIQKKVWLLIQLLFFALTEPRIFHEQIILALSLRYTTHRLCNGS